MRLKSWFVVAEVVSVSLKAVVLLLRRAYAVSFTSCFLKKKTLSVLCGWFVFSAQPLTHSFFALRIEPFLHQELLCLNRVKFVL